MFRDTCSEVQIVSTLIVCKFYRLSLKKNYRSLYLLIQKIYSIGSIKKESSNSHLFLKHLKLKLAASLFQVKEKKHQFSFLLLAKLEVTLREEKIFSSQILPTLILSFIYMFKARSFGQQVSTHLTVTLRLRHGLLINIFTLLKKILTICLSQIFLVFLKLLLPFQIKLG